MLNLRQMYDRLDEYYLTHFGARTTDEWFVGPENTFKFERGDKIVTLTCDPETGRITEEAKEMSKR